MTQKSSGLSEIELLIIKILVCLIARRVDSCATTAMYVCRMWNEKGKGNMIVEHYAEDVLQSTLLPYLDDHLHVYFQQDYARPPYCSTNCKLSSRSWSKCYTVATPFAEFKSHGTWVRYDWGKAFYFPPSSSDFDMKSKLLGIRCHKKI